MRFAIALLSLFAFPLASHASIELAGSVNRQLKEFEINTFAESPDCTYKEWGLDGWQEFPRTDEKIARIKLKNHRYSIKREVSYKSGIRRCTYELWVLRYILSFQGYKPGWGSNASLFTINVSWKPVADPTYIHLSQVRGIRYVLVGATAMTPEHHARVLLMRDGSEIPARGKQLYILASEDGARFELDIEIPN